MRPIGFVTNEKGRSIDRGRDTPSLEHRRIRLPREDE